MCSSRDDRRGNDAERDSKRSRRSGFDDAPVAPQGGYAPAPASYAPPGLDAPPGPAPPAGVAEADFARAIKEAAARAASIMAAAQGGQGAPPMMMPHAGGHGDLGAGYPPAPAPGGYAPPPGGYGAPPGGAYGAPPPATGGYPMPLGGGFAGGPPAPAMGGYGAPPPAMAMGYGAPLGGGSEQEVLNVNPDTCGKIIGRGGETIAQLQQQTGANIKVQSASEVAFGQPRRVTIVGTPQAVAAAKRIIEVRNECCLGPAWMCALVLTRFASVCPAQTEYIRAEGGYSGGGGGGGGFAGGGGYGGGMGGGGGGGGYGDGAFLGSVRPRCCSQH
jgi:hypothetical protein